MNLSNEHKIVIAASRLTNDHLLDDIEMLLDNNLNWAEIIRYASKNKVHYLLYHNFKKCGLHRRIPLYYRRLLNDSIYCNNIRNKERLLELENLQIQMKNNGIPFSPVKGGYLIDNVYKDRSIRATTDIDVLIKRRDIRNVEKIMVENGYVLGEYNAETNNILIPDKKKKMLYKTTMYNLLPYVKTSNTMPNTAVIFDLSFALDFSLNTKPVDEMLDMAVKTDAGLELLPEHFLVHMCCHHYREASNVAWLLIGKDLNLIKFCDVREFILQKMNSNSINRAIQFAKKYGLEKAIYFTIYFTKEIYNDGYEAEILESLNIEDGTFLYQFGEKDYDELQTRKKDFWTSLFSDNNRDEVSQAPKYENLIGGDL